MSTIVDNYREDEPMDEVDQLLEPALSSKKPHRGFPLAPTATNREGVQVPEKEIEYTVWNVYNNEARKVDTELVNDWKESLNSLLLFAAIFAAVLTAFIIESKKLLEPDQTQILVQIVSLYFENKGDISNITFSLPEFVLPSGAVQINCLLFASLGASLFAALLSVVALQWVGDYDAAITRPGSSPEDRAKRRQFRYAGVVGWKMGEIIAALPLFLYSSVALFWAGAIQWIWTLHPTVGYVVAGGTAMAVLLYVSTTLMGAVFVSAPFRTPLSRGLYWLFQPSLSTLHKGFSKSPLRIIFPLPGRIYRVVSKNLKPLNQSFADTHVAQIARWMQTNVLPGVTASQREDKAASTDESTGDQALCWLAHQLPVSVNSHRKLLLLVSEVLNRPPRQALLAGFFKAQGWWIFDVVGWHYLQKALSGTLSEDDQEGLRPLSRCKDVPEIRDKMMAVEKYEPRVSSAAYRKQYGLRKQKLKPAVNAALLLARDVPTTLSQAYANSPYPDVRSAAASALFKMAHTLAEPADGIRAIVPSFFELLKNSIPGVRLVAVSILAKFAEQPEFCETIRDVVPTLVEMLSDGNSYVQSSAASVIGKLAEQVEFREAVRKAIPPLMKMLNDGNSDVQFSAASVIGKLAKQAELREAVRDAIPSLVETLKDPRWDTRSNIASALGKLAEQAELCQDIRDVIPSLIEMIKYRDSGVRLTTVTAFGKFAEQVELREAIRDTIPSLFETLKDKYPYARSAAAFALDKLAEQVEFRETVRDAIPALVEALKDRFPVVLSTAASAIFKVTEQAEAREAVRDVIPSLVEMLKDSRWLPEQNAAWAFGKLAEQAELREAIRDAIPSIVELLKDSHRNTRSNAALALEKLAEQAELREAIRDAIPSLVKMLRDRYPTIRSTAVVTLGKLAEQVKLCQTIGNATLPLVELLNDGDSVTRSAAASALEKIAEQAGLRDTTRDAISSLIKLLNQGVVSTAANSPAENANRAELREAIRVVFPLLVEMLNDVGWIAGAGVASALGKQAGPEL